MIFLCWASSSLSGHRYTGSGHPVQILHGAVTSRYKHQKILLQELNRIRVVDALDVLAKIGAMDDKLKILCPVSRVMVYYLTTYQGMSPD